jgi:predicted glycosyltransferase involved in capsule biosynthesis
MISFIVPVYYKNSNSYVVKRAFDLINYFKKLNIDLELVIADASKKSVLKSDIDNIKIIRVDLKEKLFSPAIARNKAVEYSTKPYIIFFDVDLSFHQFFIENLIKEIKEKLENRKENFLMLPCLYLTKKGTIFFEDSKNKLEAINVLRKSLLEGDNLYVDRLALNTSLIVLKKEYFYEVGKFDESFYGHGGEDFEFLHRLVSFNPHSIKNDDYYVNEVSQFPARYKGFRKYMAYYSFEYFFTDLLIVHRWHKRSLFNNFYMKKVKNHNMLVLKMKEHDNNPSLKGKIWFKENKQLEYDKYILFLLKKYNFNPNKYFGLFKYKNDIKLKRPLSNKVRKLIINPKKFFEDMKIIKFLKGIIE